MQSKKYLEVPGKFCGVLMLTFVLSLSVMFIQTITLGLIRTFYIYNISPNQNQQVEKTVNHQKLIENSSKEFMADGSVNLLYSDYSLPEYQQLMIYDLNDNLLWQGKENELPDEYLKWSNSTQYSMNYDYMMDSLDSMFPDSHMSFTVPILNGRELVGLWRYNQIQEYFECFDKNGNIIAYCGSNGFTKEKSQIKPLEKATKLKVWVPVQGGGPVVLWVDDSNIFQIDFRKKNFQKLLHITDDKIRDILLHNWMELGPDSEYYQMNEGYRPLIFCRTENNSTYVVLRDPNESFQIKKPDDLKIDISNVTATHDRIYMRATSLGIIPPANLKRGSDAFWKWYQERLKQPVEYAEELYDVDSSGNIKLINKFEWVRSPREIEFSKEGMLEQKAIDYLAKISPVFFDIFSRALFGLLTRFNMDYLSLYSDIFRFNPNYNIVSYLLSLVLAGIAFIHAWPRRKSILSLIIWIVFVFLFNIVGLLVYLALNFTPTIKCHQCNKKRGLNTPHCPHCGAELSTKSPEKICIITES